MIALATWQVVLLALLVVGLVVGAWRAGWMDGRALKRAHVVDDGPWREIEQQRRARFLATAPARGGNVLTEDEAAAQDEAYAAPRLDDATSTRLIVLVGGSLRLELLDGERRVIGSYAWGERDVWRLFRAYARVRHRPVREAKEQGEAS